LQKLLSMPGRCWLFTLPDSAKNAEPPLAALKVIVGRNNESQGNRTCYHETITLTWIAAIVRFLAGRDRNRPISVLADQLLEECSDREYLALFYSRERLFSVEARSHWVFPDLAEIEQPEPAQGRKRG
jgi:hypothetical protein